MEYCEKIVFETRKLSHPYEATVVVVVRKVYCEGELVEEYDEKILAFDKNYCLVSL